MKVLIFLLLLSVLLVPVTAGTCNPEITGCIGCADDDPTLCTMCAAGTKLMIEGDSGPRQCTVCEEGSGKAADTLPQSSNGSCDVSCSPGCLVCAETGSKCLLCGDGYFLIAKTGECAGCSGGFGSSKQTFTNNDDHVAALGLDTACTVTCEPRCINCKAYGNCRGCNPGFYMVDYGSFTACLSCLNKGDGYGKVGDTSFGVSSSRDSCHQCAEGCMWCGAPNECLGCKMGYAYSAEDKTCTKCPTGFTTAASNLETKVSTTCTACSNKCADCLGTATNCLGGCAAGHFYTRATNTCTQCDQGKGRPADTSRPDADTICHACVGLCGFCAEPDKCLGCIVNHALDFTEKKCTVCPAGRSNRQDDTVRRADRPCGIVCDPQCAFCSGARDTCVGCQAGYRLDFDEKECLLCAENTGSIADIAIQTESTSCTAVTCDPSCLTCTSVATECLSCKNPHTYLDYATKKCETCPTPGFTRAPDTATQLASTTCNVACDAGCTFCEGTATNCKGCAAGYFFDDATSTCSVCDTGDGRAADTAIATGPTSCAPCDPNSNCQFCTGVSTECIGCKAGFRLDYFSKKCIRCTGGTGRAADTVPHTKDTVCNIECKLGCETCLGLPDACVRCDQGYFRADDGVCRLCDAGTGKARDTVDKPDSTNHASECTGCHETCLHCKGPGVNECLGCRAPYRMTSFNTCTLCGDGFYGSERPGPLYTKLAPTTLECVDPCHISCASCTENGADKCLACANSYYWTGTGTDPGTCTRCTPRSWKSADTTRQSGAALDQSACTACADNCFRCFGGNSNQCLKCNAGFVFKTATSSCELCPIGTTKVEDTDEADAPTTCGDSCHPACSRCILKDVSTSCSICTDGHYLSATSTCLQCPAGRGSSRSPTVATPVFATAQEGCPVVCHPSCSLCSGPLSSQCLMCSAGFYWSGDGVCSSCPQGKGSSASTSLKKDQGAEVPDDVCITTCTVTNNCETCKNDNKCVLCKRGYYLNHAAGTCTLCPEGKGKPVDTEVAEGMETCSITCHPDCLTCSGSTAADCLTCPGGRFLSAAGGCNLCTATPGKGKAPHTAEPEAAETEADCNLNCEYMCANCFGENANECVLCRGGFYRSGATSCSYCPFGKGSLIQTTSFGDIQTDGGAQACDKTCQTGCAHCKDDSATGCIRCKDSYYFGPSVGQCTICPDGQGKPGDVEFSPKYEVPSSTSCGNCNPSTNNCLSCNGDGECTRCRAGRYVTAALTCEFCPSGKGKAAETNTVSPTTPDATSACDVTCDASCNNCINNQATGCLNCATNYKWTGSTGTCTACGAKETKPIGTAVKATTDAAEECIACELQCAKCQDTAGKCLYCDAAYFYSAANTCTLCGNGLGKAADTGIVDIGTETSSCITCHASCDRCSGTGATDCLHCAAGHFLSAAGTCSLCPETKGNALIPWISGDAWMPVGTGNDRCTLNCHADCSSCSAANDNTKCIGCAAGKYFTTTGSCAQCPAGTGKAADTSLPTPAATSAASTCAACHTSCALCKGPNANDCILCAAGYFLSAANTCTLCSRGVGKPADSAPATIAANAQAGCLTSCHSTCDTCSGETENDCINCAAGYFWEGSGKCTRCDAGSGKAADAVAQTAALLSSACTVQCSPGCQVCLGDATTCMLCSDGYFYSNDNECTLCPVGFGKLKDASIPTQTVDSSACTIDCHDTCGTCTSTTATTCLSCAAGFYFSPFGSCTGCEATKGKAADTTTFKLAQAASSCVSCDPSCNKCKGTGLTDCINCNDGFYLSEAGTCTSCPATKGSARALPNDFNYPAATTDTAVGCPLTCHENCQTCKGTGATDCLSCNAGFFLSAPGVCTLCAIGSGKSADSLGASDVLTNNAACGPCDGGCAQCADSAVCISCKPGYWRSGANACTACSPGSGGPGSFVGGTPTTAEAGCPATCHSNCIACSGPGANECLQCKAGTYLSAQGSCDLCPFGTGKVADTTTSAKSTTAGTAECTLTCHDTCRNCGAAASATDCVNCRAGHFHIDTGACSPCPEGKGKPADTTLSTDPQTAESCTATCHSSCKTCAGTTANDCASCGAGHYWSGTGNGIIQKCEPCPRSRGKPADFDDFPTTPSLPAICRTFCDLCEAGCLTCSNDPAECALCIDTKYLKEDKTCGDCPLNCAKCSDATKCDTCEDGFELTADGKSCLKCQVLNCATCATDPFKCTKCADKFTLKSETECFFEPTQAPLALNLSTISIASTPQLAMNILENTVELPFSARESTNFVAITMEDADDNKVYSCADLRCSYSIRNEKLKFEFNTDITIKKGKLKIDRGADTKKSSIVGASSDRNLRLLQELANYPITIDGISLMKNSRLSTAAFATRVIVGILRLPLSLLVFWKFPHIAMMMDTMVTHLKVYSLMSQPYLAYVEVVFQSVSDSKVLPFNFDNPFEHWNSNTLQCAGFVGLRSKNMYCSFFDNYGENIIGIASVALTCLILILLSKKMLQNTNMGTSPKHFWQTIFTSYGLDFFITKLDANHLEIGLMTLVAYSTADHSSKSVIGIIFGTSVLIAFGFIARHVTNAVRRSYESSSSTATSTKAAAEPSGASVFTQPESASDIALDSQIANFVLSKSTTPTNRWSVFFFAARYIRALLLVIFVATVRDPVDQIILIVILESVYLVALILLDFRGSRLERFFNIGMHAVILAHLICRAVATSKNISEDQLQSSLATAIVVFLLIYVFAHVLACILVVIGIFLKDSAKQTHQPVNASSTKIEMSGPRQPQELYRENPVHNEQSKAHNPGSPVSYIDMPVPPEVYDNQRGQSVHNGNPGSKQENPNSNPVSYIDMPLPAEMNNNAGGEYPKESVKAPISFVDIDIPQE